MPRRNRKNNNNNNNTDEDDAKQEGGQANNQQGEQKLTRKQQRRLREQKKAAAAASSSSGGRRKKGQRGPEPLADSDDSDDEFSGGKRGKGNNRGNRKGKGRGKRQWDSSSDEEDDPDVAKAREALKRNKDWPEYVFLKGTSPLAPGQSKLRDVNVQDVRITVPGQVLMEDTVFKLTYGIRYGLVGRNGTGKSVLLRHVAHRLSPFNHVPKHIRFVYVEQEIEGDDRPPLQTVLESNMELQWLLQQEAIFMAADKKAEEGDHTEEDRLEAELSYTLRDIHERLNEMKAAKATARASTILAGLGFLVDEMKTKPTKEFSGGWRMRVAIAQALFQEPEFLFLDEPTNHLDIVTAIWLENYLASWKKGLLVVSHDAEFLDGISQQIIHLSHGRLDYYKGDYETFAKARAQRLRANKKQVNKQAKADKKLKELKGKNRKVAKAKEKMASRDGRVKEIRDDPSLQFHFPDPGRIDYPMLQCREVSFQYPGTEKEIFPRLDFGIHEDSRVALVGPNGVGKSTLMQLLTGELKPTKGEVYRNHHLRVARFTQHHIDQLIMDENPVELLCSRFKSPDTQRARNLLAKFGLRGKLAVTPISKLSGGQKSRVAFASIAWQSPHLMLLDEPTNHLDMPMIESFADALRKFEGPIVLITHNQFLIDQVCNEIWLMSFGGKVERFDGDFDEYKRRIVQTMPIWDSYDF